MQVECPLYSRKFPSHHLIDCLHVAGGKSLNARMESGRRLLTGVLPLSMCVCDRCCVKSHNSRICAQISLAMSYGPLLQADAVNITRHLLHEHSSEHPEDAPDFEVVQACHSILKVSLKCLDICGLVSKTEVDACP